MSSARATLLIVSGLALMLAGCIERAPSVAEPDPTRPWDAAPSDGGQPSDAAPADAAPADAAPDAAASDAAGADMPPPDAAPGRGTFTRISGPASGFADGVGGRARFTLPRCLARRGAVLYVVDGGNQAIRAVDLDTRVVTTIAGQPGDGEHVDGVGVDARFGDPRSCALIGETLYVADEITIRAVDIDRPDAPVTTVAGSAHRSGFTDGVGRAVRFAGPFLELNAAPDGTLHILDGNNGAFRHFDPATGRVTTIERQPAGGGPFGDLAFSPGGGPMYLFDGGSGRVVRHDLETGETAAISDIFARNRSDLNIALDGGTAWIAGLGPHLFAVDLDTGALEVWFEGDRFEADRPRDGGPDVGRLGFTGSSVVVDRQRDALYYADLNNHAVRRIDRTQLAISTIAGRIEPYGHQDGFDPRFDGVWSIAHDGERWLVTDTHNNVIRAVAPSGEVTTVIGRPEDDMLLDGPVADARLQYPRGLFHDGARLYFTDFNTVRVVADGVVTTIADGFRGARSLAVAPDGLVYVLDYETAWRLETDGVHTPLAPVGQLDSDGQIAVGPDGAVYVSHPEQRVIYRLRVGAEPEVAAGIVDRDGLRDGPLAHATFVRPDGITFAPDGALFVSDRGCLRRVDFVTGQVDTPYGDPDGRLPLLAGDVVPLEGSNLPQSGGLAFHDGMIGFALHTGVGVARLPR